MRTIGKNTSIVSMGGGGGRRRRSSVVRDGNGGGGGASVTSSIGSSSVMMVDGSISGRVAIATSPVYHLQRPPPSKTSSSGRSHRRTGSRGSNGSIGDTRAEFVELSHDTFNKQYLSPSTAVDTVIEKDDDMMGDFMMYCTSKLCFGGDNAMDTIVDERTASLDDSNRMFRQRNGRVDDEEQRDHSLRMTSYDEQDLPQLASPSTLPQPLSSMDPQSIFRRTNYTTPSKIWNSPQNNTTSALNDEWSCDSSLSSTGLLSLNSSSIRSRGSTEQPGMSSGIGSRSSKGLKKKVLVVVDALTSGPDATAPHGLMGLTGSGGGRGARGGTASRRSAPMILDRVDERPCHDGDEDDDQQSVGSQGSKSSAASLASSVVTAASNVLPENWNALFGGSGGKKKRPASSRSVTNDGRTSYHHSRAGQSSSNSMWMSLSVLDEDRFNHRVLGTSTTDHVTRPHILTNSIMDGLQRYLPYSKQGELFWLKYSMVRDGASLRTVLHKTKLSSFTVMAVETMDGEVFGAFTAKPWHITWKFYGTPESFLWRLSKPRSDTSDSKTKRRQDGKSSAIQVFRYAGNNQNVQLCNSDRIAVGGGAPDEDSVVSDELSHVKLTEWGFGLSFDKHLQEGTSSPCMTFNSPSLSKIHSDGSKFQVSNIEFWTLTPCMTVDDAQRMEEGKFFVERDGIMSL